MPINEVTKADRRIAKLDAELRPLLAAAAAQGWDASATYDIATGRWIEPVCPYDSREGGDAWDRGYREKLACDHDYDMDSEEERDRQRVRSREAAEAEYGYGDS